MRQGLQTVSNVFVHRLAMYSPSDAPLTHFAIPLASAVAIGRMVLHRVQFVHTVSDLGVHALASYVPVSSKALHLVHGTHFLSANSVQGLTSHSPVGHDEVQGLHTLYAVGITDEDDTLGREHASRSTKNDPGGPCGHEVMLVQFAHAETSALSMPKHVMFAYMPAYGQAVAHVLHWGSSSTVHCPEMYLFAPQELLHAEHLEK